MTISQNYAGIFSQYSQIVKHPDEYYMRIKCVNAISNNISMVIYQSVLLVEESLIRGENMLSSKRQHNLSCILKIGSSPLLRDYRFMIFDWTTCCLPVNLVNEDRAWRCCLSAMSYLSWRQPIVWQRWYWLTKDYPESFAWRLEKIIPIKT